MLPHREALAGGAAGGGKSDMILMGALQWVEHPGYAAILFRRSFADLSLPGALIDRSQQWLGQTDARWDSRQHEWIFPSGAKVSFGYLDSETSRYRYQSAEFQYIGFDEATQFPERDYLYLFSRLRRLKSSPVPLRMRGATNPGGIGMKWVKERFAIRRDQETGRFRGFDPKKPFIPSRITDNPFLDQKEYIESLMNLDPVTREQLLHGDWEVAESGRFRKEWIRRYSVRPNHYVLGPDLKGEDVAKGRCWMFSVCDPAASTREGPGDYSIGRRQPSWTVISTFAVTPTYEILWLDNWRARCEVPDIQTALIDTHIKWGVDFIGIENTGIGLGVFQTAKRSGLPIRPLKPGGKDKLVRATDACNRMEQGMIYLPQRAPWLDDLENELWLWTGHPDETADQVDCLAYAAKVASEFAVGGPREQTVNRNIDLRPEIF